MSYDIKRSVHVGPLPIHVLSTANQGSLLIESPVQIKYEIPPILISKTKMALILDTLIKFVFNMCM